MRLGHAGKSFDEDFERRAAVRSGTETENWHTSVADTPRLSYCTSSTQNVWSK